MLALLFVSSAGAADWKITPGIELSEIYTDNVRLSAPGTERSDFITQVSPSIAIIGTGRRLKIDARYAMQNLAYARTNGSIATHHLLNANAQAELVPDLFFLNGRASIGRQAISAFGAQSTSTATLSPNQTDVRTYSINPYLLHRFGSTATAEARYTRDAVTSGVGGLSDSHADRAVLGLNSGPAFRTLGWGLRYSLQKTRFDNLAPIQNEEASLSLRYLLSSQFSLTASGGHEKNNYLSIANKPEGTFWNAGIAWAPTVRTSIRANAGRRFYGDAYSLLASHRSRRTVWNVGYLEDVTTTRSQFLLPVTTDTAAFLDQLWLNVFPDEDIRRQVIEDFIRDAGLPPMLAHSVNSFTNRVFLQKRWQASVALNGVRNTVVLSLHDTRREAQTAGGVDSALLGPANVALEDRTRQSGANLLWNWRISPRTNANASAGYNRIESLATGQANHTRTYRMAVARQFQPKLKGTLEVRRLQQDSNLPGSTVRENAINASLQMTF